MFSRPAGRHEARGGWISYEQTGRQGVWGRLNGSKSPNGLAVDAMSIDQLVAFASAVGQKLALSHCSGMWTTVRF
jgi:hypothetical protein